MRITYDEAADAAYIYLVHEIGYGAVTRTLIGPVIEKGTAVNLDFADGGRLLGIELLGAHRLLAPDVIAHLKLSE